MLQNSRGVFFLRVRSAVGSATHTHPIGRPPKRQKDKEIYNKIDSVESERDLWFAKGQVSILRQMIALEEATKLAVEELDI